MIIMMWMNNEKLEKNIYIKRFFLKSENNNNFLKSHKKKILKNAGKHQKKKYKLKKNWAYPEKSLRKFSAEILWCKYEKKIYNTQKKILEAAKKFDEAGIRKNN